MHYTDEYTTKGLKCDIILPPMAKNVTIKPIKMTEYGLYGY